MLCGALPGKSHLKERHVLIPGTVELIENGIQSCDALGGPLLKDIQKNKATKVVNTRRFMRTHTLSVVGCPILLLEGNFPAEFNFNP